MNKYIYIQYVNVNMYIYTYTYKYVYIYLSYLIHTYMYIHTYIYIYMYIHTYIYLDVNVYVHVCVNVYFLHLSNSRNDLNREQCLDLRSFRSIHSSRAHNSSHVRRYDFLQKIHMCDCICIRKSVHICT